MKTTRLLFLLSLIILAIVSCQAPQQETSFQPGQFGYDVHLLQQYQDAFVLEHGQAKILVSTEYQGRIMTSTAKGDEGPSYGWINEELIRTDSTIAHFNPYGGEDRFWLGPEGGQFSLYFKPGTDFVFDEWFVPAAFDTEPFELVEKKERRASFRKAMSLVNYSGTELNIEVDRKIALLDANNVSEIFGLSPDPNLEMVAFQSINTITNTGDSAWTKETGMPSIWILGMFIPSDLTTIIIPFEQGDSAELGPKVIDNYFGKVPEDRLTVKDRVLFFKGDGKYRSKIGIPPLRAEDFAGSYDESKKLLTIVAFSREPGNTNYVNSLWELQEDPFSGDVVNSYNDGPLDNGVQLGPFYELETSSPAANLASGESLTHTHTTLHLSGDEALLSQFCESVLGVSLREVLTGIKE